MARRYHVRHLPIIRRSSQASSSLIRLARLLRTAWKWYQCANLDKISAVSGIPGHFEKCLPLGRLLGLRLRLIAPAAVGVRGRTGGHQIVFQKKRIRKGWLWSGETETLRSRGSSSFHSRHNRRRALRHIRQSRSCHRREQSFAHSGVRHALLPPAVDGSSAPCGAELLFFSSLTQEELHAASGRADPPRSADLSPAA